MFVIKCCRLNVFNFEHRGWLRLTEEVSDPCDPLNLFCAVLSAIWVKPTCKTDGLMRTANVKYVHIGILFVSMCQHASSVD